MLQHQLGIVEETVYGTPVTVTRFLELLPGESLGRTNTILNSSGLRPDVYAGLGSRRVQTARQGAGNLSFEVATSGFGLLFKHMFGAVATAQQGATAAYKHTFTPGTLTGKSLTIQKGVEKNTNAAQPFTFHGCKIVNWGFAIAKDGLLILELGIDSEDVDTSTGLAVASYPAISLFHFAQATLSIDASPVANVSDCNIKGTNPMDTDRRFLGNAGLKAEPLENDRRTIDGSLTAEFANITSFYNAFAADTSLALELEFVGALIETPYSETLTITLADTRLTGETPKITGPEPAVQGIPFEAFETDAGASITVEYTCTDVTP